MDESPLYSVLLRQKRGVIWQGTGVVLTPEKTQNMTQGKGRDRGTPAVRETDKRQIYHDTRGGRSKRFRDLRPYLGQQNEEALHAYDQHQEGELCSR